MVLCFLCCLTGTRLFSLSSQTMLQKKKKKQLSSGMPLDRCSCRRVDGKSLPVKTAPLFLSLLFAFCAVPSFARAGQLSLASRAPRRGQAVSPTRGRRGGGGAAGGTTPQRQRGRGGRKAEGFETLLKAHAHTAADQRFPTLEPVASGKGKGERKQDMHATCASVVSSKLLRWTLALFFFFCDFVIVLKLRLSERCQNGQAYL